MSYHPLMNDTKWEEIRTAMIEFPEPTFWRTKDIETGYISHWDRDWYYHFRTGGYNPIEWLEIKFENAKIKEELVNILRKIHVPGELSENRIRIYGYVKPGTFIDYI